ncbi:MAG: ABC transporter ATP-binding protein [Thermoproteota archaeon]
MLKVENLSAGYGKVPILFDVTLRAKRKEITVIVGPNGSGKSTLLKTIFGLTTVYNGSIFFEEQDIQKLKPHKRIGLGIAYVQQVNNVFANLTVKENLLMAGYALPKPEAVAKVDEVLEHFPILKPSLKRVAETLSGGERQMLAIAMALIRKPKLMMFDEPTGNLAPKVATQVFDLIMKLRNDFGITIILVEQNTRKALEIGDYAYLLVSGRVAFNGPAKKLLEHPKLGSIYLGVRKV